MLTASERLNLYRVEATGREESGAASSLAFGEGLGAAIRDINLSEVGLDAGDHVWARGKVRNDVAGENTRLRLVFLDGADAQVGEVAGAYADNDGVYAETVLAANVIPIGAVIMRAVVDRESGAGAVAITDVAIGGGKTARPYSLPVRGPHGFALNTLDRNARVTQERARIEGRSPFTGRVQQTRLFERWRCDIQVPPLLGDDLRLYEDDLASLSSGARTFNLIMPRRYWGPAGEAAGALLRTLAGADQTGMTINMTGAGTDALIARRGDFVSIQIGAALNGPYAVYRLSADVIDAAGTVSIKLREPVFPAPPDGAHMRFTQPIMTASVNDDETTEHDLSGFGHIQALGFEQRFEVLE